MCNYWHIYTRAQITWELTIWHWLCTRFFPCFFFYRFFYRLQIVWTWALQSGSRKIPFLSRKHKTSLYSSTVIWIIFDFYMINVFAAFYAKFFSKRKSMRQIDLYRPFIFLAHVTLLVAINYKKIVIVTALSSSFHYHHHKQYSMEPSIIDAFIDKWIDL